MDNGTNFRETENEIQSREMQNNDNDIKEEMHMDDIRKLIEQAETIVFDIGNVLVGFAWEDYLGSLGFDEETYEHVADAMFRNEDWDVGDSGLATTQEWLALFIENDPAYEEQIRYIFENFGKSIVPYGYTRSWTMGLKQRGKKLYFLSNYSEEMFRQSKEQLDFLGFFDGGVFSWEEKCMKPDDAIYRVLLKRYRLTPGKCVFFDDRIENVEGARKAGMKAVLFRADIPLQLLNS